MSCSGDVGERCWPWLEGDHVWKLNILLITTYSNNLVRHEVVGGSWKILLWPDDGRLCRIGHADAGEGDTEQRSVMLGDAKNYMFLCCALL